MAANHTSDPATLDFINTLIDNHLLGEELELDLSIRQIRFTDFLKFLRYEGQYTSVWINKNGLFKAIRWSCIMDTEGFFKLHSLFTDIDECNYSWDTQLLLLKLIPVLDKKHIVIPIRDAKFDSVKRFLLARGFGLVKLMGEILHADKPDVRTHDVTSFPKAQDMKDKTRVCGFLPRLARMIEDAAGHGQSSIEFNYGELTVENRLVDFLKENGYQVESFPTNIFKISW